MCTTYLHDLLGIYDEFIREEWFTDGLYKTISDDIMEKHKYMSAERDNIKQTDLEYAKEKNAYNEYVDLCTDVQRSFIEAIDETKRLSKDVRNGGFRLACIFQRFNKMNPVEGLEYLEKSGTSLQELKEELGAYVKYKVFEDEGKKYAIDMETYKIYDEDLYLKINILHEVGEYLPESGEVCYYSSLIQVI